MNRKEFLLTKVAEEGGELGQRAIKIIHFGLGEVEPGQALTNTERMIGEYADVLAMVEMLVDDGHIVLPDLRAAINAKKAKVERFLLYSAECGTFDPEPKKEKLQ